MVPGQQPRHSAPLTRLAYLVVERFGDLNYLLAAVVPATLAAALFLELIWLGQSPLGGHPVVLALALVGATSVPVLRVVLWWDAAFHVLGAAVCMTVCVAGFGAFSRHRSRVVLAVSVAALAAGLLVQERPLLVPIRYLFGVGLDEPPRWSRSWLGNELRLWTPYVVITVAYLVYRWLVFNSAPAPGSLHEALGLLASGTARSYLPSLVGIRSAPDSGYLDIPTILGLLVLFVTAAYVAARRRGLWKCVAFLAATYLVNLGMLAAGRLGVVNAVWQSRDLQYFVDVHLAPS